MMFKDRFEALKSQIWSPFIVSVELKRVKTQRIVFSAFFAENFRPTIQGNSLQVSLKSILGLLRIKIPTQYSPENKSNYLHIPHKSAVFCQSYGGLYHG